MAKKEEQTEEVNVPVETNEEVNTPVETNEEEVNTPVETNEEVVLVSGADFWNFDEEPEFVGIYGRPVIREKDGDGEEQKAGTEMGFIFVDTETGEEVIIGNSHQVEKALLMDVEGTKVKDLHKPKLRIRFLGKYKNSAGKPFNKFKISLISYEK